MTWLLASRSFTSGASLSFRSSRCPKAACQLILPIAVSGTRNLGQLVLSTGQVSVGFGRAKKAVTAAATACTARLGAFAKQAARTAAARSTAESAAMARTGKVCAQKGQKLPTLTLWLEPV